MSDPRVSLAAGMPVSWATGYRPHEGAWCSNCRTARWWTRDGEGWCCAMCHPPHPKARVTHHPAA